MGQHEEKKIIEIFKLLKRKRYTTMTEIHLGTCEKHNEAFGLSRLFDNNQQRMLIKKLYCIFFEKYVAHEQPPRKSNLST